MHVRRLTAIAALCAIGAVIACSDSSPVAPKSAGAPSAGRLKPGIAKGPQNQVKVLRWSGSGLKKDITVSGTFGKDGGVLVMRDLGVVFTVPAGALTRKKTITLTALAGHHVVFQGAPEGTRFRIPATLQIDLTHTNAYHDKKLLNILVGGYLSSAASINADDTALDTEDNAAITDDAVTTATFPVPHFSVVILASQIHCSNCTNPHGPPQ